ncbi:AP-4 complex subunit beta-1-like isoform X2 [Nematostella vectensis]|uniref:AP-4 complex subunit beta-1-like isoform X2 n=1 Tax=Nematostella vectensis TaxID=45351 RepID=UPI002076F9B1|nr:AP-4 complex subunit beta-1-like isoform X2 [Nematostella vectensis]
MSDMTYFGETGRKGEVSELRKLLEQADLRHEQTQYTRVIQRVIACMTTGMNMSSLFMQMIKAGATNNLVQKKLVYLYICTYAQSNPQLALLTVNTLTKDAQDRSAMIRGLAIRSMTSLRLPDLLEYIEEPVVAGLSDPSQYVRRTAAIGCVKLYHLNPDFVEEHQVIQKLQALIEDQDPLVMCNCLSALDEVLSADGGLQVDQALAHFLMKRLTNLSEWGQSQVLGLLVRYTPFDDQELYEILNATDVYLKSPNGAVVMACINLFIHLSKSARHLEEDILERIKGPLLTLLSSTNYELIFTVLCHIELLIAREPQLFVPDYKMFFSRFNDPQFLRRKKLQILTTISSESNVEEVVTELSASVHDVDIDLAKESIHAIGQIALVVPSAAEYSIDTLLSFLSYEIEYISAKTLAVISDLFPSYEKYCLAVLPQLNECMDLVQDPDGKAAIIWITGEYGQFVSESSYMLEAQVEHIEEEQSAEIKLQLLTAAMKLFFKRPPECQDLLGRLLAHFIDKEVNTDVHDRALLYYRLLEAGVEQAKRIVCDVSDRTLGSPRKARKDEKFMETLFSEFNTLSVVYDQRSISFTKQTIPFIKGQLFQGQKDSSERNNSTATPADMSLPQSNKVVVGNLLGHDVGLETPNHNSLMLGARPSLSASDFQKKWMTLLQSASFAKVLSSRVFFWCQF